MATSNVVIGEGQVTFKRTQGHIHDGLTSTLIDTSKYSIFDFTVAENGKDTKRKQSQENNVRMLKTFIIDTIEGRVLKPEGIAIQANAITAREIVAGTITANELSSNIVLVNNIIRSSNFINNTTTQTGWAIYSNGTGIFNSVNIRGNIYLSNTGGSSFNSSNTALYADINGRFSLKDKLTWDGNTLTIRGTLQFPDGSTPGTFDNGDGLSAGTIGGITINNTDIRGNYSAGVSGFLISSNGNAEFNNVTVRGDLRFANNTIPGTFDNGDALTGGSIGGVVISPTSIYAGAGSWASSNTPFYLDVNGFFSLKEKLYWNPTTNLLTISGSMSASTISGSSMSMISTPFTGFSYDQYRLNLYDTAKIRAEMRYQCDANGDGASVTSYVDINNVGSAIDGARVGVTSTTGGNTQIRAGFVEANLLIAGPMKPVLAAASPTHIGVDSGGYISYVTSRRELKYEIENFIELDIIDQFVPRTFKWKKTGRGEESEVQRIARESEYAIGFIVEEVEEIQNGRFVTYEDRDRTKPLYWKTDNFIAMLVAEVQDLRKRVKELENGV